MDDLISRQAAIDAVDTIGHIATMPDGDKCVRRSAVKYTLSMLPSAQPEHDAEFWRKRAEKYSDICLAMTAEMTKGIKFDSIRIDENGICFGKEQPEITEDQVKEYCKKRCLTVITDDLYYELTRGSKNTATWLIRRWGDDARCSNCGHTFKDVYDMDNHDRFCRFCGSKMVGVKGVKA